MALMIGFCITAPMLDVFAKLAAAEIPVGQIAFARFVVQAALMLPICWVLGRKITVVRRDLPLMIARSLCLLAATICFFAAIRVMPIADALAIAFVEPFILLLLGYLIFKDTIGPRRIIASATGFCGALLVIQPSIATFGLVALFPLATAVTFAFYMIITRSLSRRVDPMTMQFQTAFIALVCSLPLIILHEPLGLTEFDIVWPTNLFWLWLFGVGVAAATSHLMMTYALVFAPASTLAPLHYLEIVTAVALGYFVFGDFPNLLTWIGIAIIVCSGLYVIQRERMDRAKSV